MLWGIIQFNFLPTVNKNDARVSRNVSLQEREQERVDEGSITHKDGNVTMLFKGF